VTGAVVHVMGWPSRQYGSFEWFLVALAEGCEGHGLRTHLVFPAPPTSTAFVSDVAAGLHVIPSPRHPGDPRFAVRLARVLHRTGATHLHAHFGVDAYHALAVATPLQVRRFATKHITPGTARRTLSRTRHRWLANRVERLFAVSRAVADGLAALGADPAKLEVCYLGIDPDAYRPVPAAPEAVRRELGLGAAAIVLSTSHLRPGKGVETLPRLAADLRADGRDVVVLAAGDGPLAGDLRRAAEALGVGAHFRLLGPRLDVPRLLAAADVVVFPTSGAEGLPLGPLEALAAGTPLVASAVSDLPVLLPGAALLVPPGDGTALAAAAGRLLDDPRLRAELAERGRRLVRERLSVRSAVDRHVRHYLA
jgi:glycosyltransferase involved in cell wall biosynthesis